MRCYNCCMSINTKLYFSGGGNYDKTVDVDVHFINSVRSTQKLSILFIPTAKNTDQLGYTKCGEWLSDKLNRLGGDDISIILETDLDKCVNLEKYGAVYLGGGNTYKLQKLIDESDFKDRLLLYIDEGGILYGASAGAVVMGSNVGIYKEEDENGYKNENGLMLCKDYAVRCHYEYVDKEKIHKFVEIYKLPVVALPLGTSILLEKGVFSIIGKGNAYIFGLDEREHELEVGECF